MKRLTISLSPQEIIQLEEWATSGKYPPQLVKRASIILLLGQKKIPAEVAREVPANKKTVIKWGLRFLERRLAGIEQDAPRNGRQKKSTTPSKEDIYEVILNHEPKESIDWTYRSLADRLKTSKTTVHRICQQYNIPLSRSALKTLLDSEMDHPITNIGGNFLGPEIQTMAFYLGCEKKSDSKNNKSIPANDLDSRILENFYKKNEELLDVNRKLISRTKEKKSGNSDVVNFLRFLDDLKRNNHKDKDIYLVMNSLAIDNDDRIANWLARHLQFSFFSIPSTDQWMDFINKRLITVEDQYKRIMALELENIITDSEIYEKDSRSYRMPFSSVIRPKK